MYTCWKTKNPSNMFTKEKGKSKFETGLDWLEKLYMYDYDA